MAPGASRGSRCRGASRSARSARRPGQARSASPRCARSSAPGPPRARRIRAGKPMCNQVPEKGPTMAETTPSAENVIAVSFEADANAYQALTALKELDTQQRVHIRGAGVVVRGEDGRVEVKDEVTDQSLSST